MAEAVRFELTDGCPSLVFKTSALNHSATLPCIRPTKSGMIPFNQPFYQAISCKRSPDESSMRRIPGKIVIVKRNEGRSYFATPGSAI